MSPSPMPTGTRRCHHCVQSVAVPLGCGRQKMGHIGQGGAENGPEAPQPHGAATAVALSITRPAGCAGWRGSTPATQRGGKEGSGKAPRFSSSQLRGGPQLPTRWGQRSLWGSHYPSPGGGGSGGRRGGQRLLGGAGGRIGTAAGHVFIFRLFLRGSLSLHFEAED